jgi:predicted RecB family nuclease
MKKITRDVLEGYMDCHYKAFLKLTSHEGVTPDNPILQMDRNSRPSLTSVGEIPLQRIKVQGTKSLKLTSSYLSKGQPLILDGIFETSAISLHIEGLQRTAGSSDIGDFHYLPAIFQRGAGAHETHKSLLEVYGFLLSSIQGRAPDKGIIWKEAGKASTIQLSPGLKRGKRIVHALTKEQQGEQPPPLVLNKHCEICEFKRRCHAQAVEEDNISLLRGISKAEIERLRKRGIFTINQLSYTFKPRRVRKRAKNPAQPHYFALQARALREKHVFVHGSPHLNAEAVRVYMDFEGTSTNRSYYLIGLLVVHAWDIHRKSFWADRDDGEAQIFMDMLDYLKSYRNYSVLHYGAYEVHALRRMQRKLSADYGRQIEELLNHAINVLSIIGPHIYFPVFSNSLKDIARFLGYKWSAADASGAQALLWRRRWDETLDERIKEKLIQYNIEDCIGLKIVSDFIDLACQHGSSAMGTQATHTDDFENEAVQRGKFQKQTFVIQEFDFINRCSYFDYQRTRMSARQVRRYKNKRSVENKHLPAIYRNNKVVDVFVSRCCVCRSKQLSILRPLQRKIVDLKFSGVAVRRWVVLYHSKEYRCRKCNHKFIPDGFPRTRTPFGKGLLCWCMYQMIIGGQNMLRIREGLATLFGIKLQVPSIYNFKQSMALHYKMLYNEILQELLTRPVLYIDETAANLRSETGYVWCVTDGRSVHYFYRNSREGSFLVDMFKDFKGLLVSDFYTAYDSLDCRKQRCLVHLMRDVNEEMKKHPFDTELKSIAAKFSAVLRSVVATIDVYGFKKRYLAKHKNMARGFCHWASQREFESLPAERIRLRIVKYQNQLFSFLDQDGVSWNNTNAEHFIKPFARYRRTANGVFTERSIKDYLVILSIAETSKGKGEDFLDFLLEDNKHRFSFKSGRCAPKEAELSDSSAPSSLPA